VKSIRGLLLGLTLVGLSFGASAEEIELGIATGDTEGTYYRFGQDLSALAAQHGIKLNVVPSRGSFENMVGIFDSRSTQLGMAQSDVVIFMNMFGEPKIKDIAREIKVVFPLYDEEVHVLAGEAIKTFADLEGKKVAIGRAGSGTAMTATVLFGVAGVTPAEQLEIGGRQAVESLVKGEVDAMLFVAGYPVKLFSEGLSADDKVHLVPIDDPKVLELYGTASTIPAGTYPWQQQEVATINVTAGLMTLDFPADNVNCAYIGKMATLIRENINWLKENGHEKWQSVDLNSPIAPELRTDCVNQGS
jgi:TRAP transporter TAXI family solute receptor